MHTSHLRRRTRVVSPASLLIALLLGASSLVLTSPPAGAATKALSGTIQGEDGRYVSAQIGIEYFDSSGTKIGADGKPMGGGYSVSLMVNASSSCCFLLPGDGWDSPTYNGTPLTKSWSTAAPSNAATAWIETYPKRSGGQPNTDTSRYGHSMRRAVALPRTGIPLKLPLGCGLSDNGVTGNNGRVLGTAYYNGAKVDPSRVGIWSQLPDANTPIMGWGLGVGLGSGKYRVGQLEPGTYTLRVTANGVTKQLYDIKVKSCGDTEVNVAVAGSLPAGVPSVSYPRDWYVSESWSPPSTAHRFTFGTTTATHWLAGDWDGNGTDTPAWFRAGTWTLRSGVGSTATTTTLSFGVYAGDIPVVGDWDGDGDDEPGIFRKGTWYLRADDTSSSYRTVAYGQAGDIPVPGDWNGDGDTDLGIVRASKWYLRTTSLPSGGTFTTFQYGLEAGDRYVVGSWDADARDEPGVFRKGSWYLRGDPSASSGTVRTVAYGATSGDAPVPGDWNGDGISTPAVTRG